MEKSKRFTLKSVKKNLVVIGRDIVRCRVYLDQKFRTIRGTGQSRVTAPASKTIYAERTAYRRNRHPLSGRRLRHLEVFQCNTEPYGRRRRRQPLELLRITGRILPLRRVDPCRLRVESLRRRVRLRRQSVCGSSGICDEIDNRRCRNLSPELSYTRRSPLSLL